jgi:lipopolysaccharide transport system permease protein
VLEKDVHIIVIKSTKGWNAIGLKEVWDYRELLYFITFREIKGKYRQTVFGPLWLILQPLFNMIIYSFLFGRVAKLPSEGVPYFIFIFPALILWQFFETGTQSAVSSLVSEQKIITKIYFPRLIIPLSTVFSAFINFLASATILFGMMLIYKVPFRPTLFLLPVFIIFTGLFALGIGLWLACLAVKFRDVITANGFLMAMLKFLSPILYSMTVIPQRWLPIYKLNPLNGLVNGFRFAILGKGYSSDVYLIYNMLIILVLFLSGVLIFKRTEKTIVDII